VLSVSAFSSLLDISVLAHGIHYAIVGVGVVGLVALLLPRFLTTPTPPRDKHEARVLALRAALTTHDLATDSPATTFDPPQVARLRVPGLTTAQRVLLPLAVVSSAAAAGVHAAVGPAHFRQATLIGLFFAGSALAQLVWAGVVAVSCSRALLVVAALGNIAVLALWGITRTIGLPFGLLPGPEAVGPWDVACGGWELIVACSCIALLQSREQLPTRIVDWRRWHPGVHWFVAASVLTLIALSLSGAGA
jgi:hypothetical protein